MIELSEVRWTHAKTYPDAPHEYVLYRNYPEVHKHYARLIKEQGIRQKFTLRGRTYIYKYYFGEDGYRYWIIQDVLNRCKVKPEERTARLVDPVIKFTVHKLPPKDKK